MKLSPAREDFKKLSETASLVAVATSIDTDLDFYPLPVARHQCNVKCLISVCFGVTHPIS